MARSAGQASVEASVADLMTRPSTPAMATRLPAGTKGTGCMEVPIIMKRPRGLPLSGSGCAWLAVERRLGWYLGPSTKRRESGRSTPLKTRAKATNTSAGPSPVAPPPPPPPSACAGGRHPTSSAARTGTTLETKATTGAASVLAHAATDARTSAIAPSSAPSATAVVVVVVAAPGPAVADTAAAADEDGMGSGGQSAPMRRCWALAGSGTTSTTMSRTAGASGSQRRKMADAVPRGSLGFSSRGGTSWDSEEGG